MISMCPEAVSCVVLREQQDGQIHQLLVKRCPQDGDFWSHVGGGIEAGETAVETIVRELKEETGLVPVRLYNSEFIEQLFQAARNRILVMPLFVAFVDEHQTVTLNREHTDFEWCALETALSRVPFYGQRQAYQHVWREFVDRQPSELLRIPVATQ